jgi:multidrug resistance protein MdtO
MNFVPNARQLKFIPGWVVWLRRELAPFPGRLPMTIRMVVSVSLVVIISMGLQVPNLAFSAFFVFFVSKENRVLTTVTGLIMIAGVTIATTLTLLLYTFTFDNPELRVPVMAVFIFTGMFLSRTFVIGPLGFVIGFLSALIQTSGENAPNPDTLVRGQLWLWIAIVYPIALTIIVNQYLLPADPWTALVQSLTIRLNTAAAALDRAIREGSAGGQTNQPLLDLATRGCTTMFGLLNFAEKRDSQIKRRHPFLVDTISASGHLATATASLEFREPVALSADDMLCAKTLLSEIGELKTIVPELSPAVASRKSPPPQAKLPQLRELQFAAESFRDSLIRGTSEYSSTIPKKQKISLFHPDAFTNPAHVRFALKVTLAAMICYLIYNGLHWPGISTSFVTCCFVALGSTGATLYKSWLRLFGCLVGGFLGYVAILLLIPQMVSITSLVLLTAVVSALLGWVAAGTERIAYAGLQAAFAFYLCVFQGFEPGFNLTLARDRVIGILLGTIVSAIVFVSVWPEHAADALRATLARVLRELSELVLIPKPGVAVETDGKHAMELHSALSKDLDNILILSEQATVESVTLMNPKRFSPSLIEHLTAHMQALGLITTALLRRTKLEEWEGLDKSQQIEEFTLRTSLSQYLRRYADFVGHGQRPEPDDYEAAFTKWNLAAANITGNDRPRLVRRLVDQIQRMV